MESSEGQLLLFENACRERGLKLTHQRLEVYRELLLACDHPTAEQLYQRLRPRIPTLSLDTVYRTLATLAKHRLINKVETVESQARFEATHHPHHHLICRECGEIIDFQWPLVDRADLPEMAREWGKIDQKSVVVHGICNKCLG